MSNQQAAKIFDSFRDGVVSECDFLREIRTIAYQTESDALFFCLAEATSFTVQLDGDHHFYPHDYQH